MAYYLTRIRSRYDRFVDIRNTEDIFSHYVWACNLCWISSDERKWIVDVIHQFYGLPLVYWKNSAWIISLTMLSMLRNGVHELTLIAESFATVLNRAPEEVKDIIDPIAKETQFVAFTLECFLLCKLVEQLNDQKEAIGGTVFTDGGSRTHCQQTFRFRCGDMLDVSMELFQMVLNTCYTLMIFFQATRGD
ncbi:hypothetical protein quinque_001487 [Culex quinquefasciatus]